MMTFIEEKIMPKAMKISQNKYLSAVSNGFMMLMPVLIIGSIFTLLTNFSIEPYQNFITSTGLKPILALPNMVTNDIISLYAVFFIAYCLAQKLNRDQGVAGMLALISFLVITPFGNTGSAIQSFLDANGLKVGADVVVPASSYLPLEWLGAKGLFVAIFVGLLSAKIYDFLLAKNLMIKMPDSVPPTISKSFAGLMPGFVLVILFLAIDKIVGLLPMEGVTGIQSGIYQLIQSPMESFLGNNIWSFIFAAFAAQFLWSLGIHGMSAVILPIFYPLWTTLNNMNVDALNAGASVYELPNILNRSFWQVYTICGGSGVTIGICIYMLFFAKSQQYKTLGKLSIVPNLCGINEPIIFGLPIVLNPVLIAPFILSPIVVSILAYLLTAINILPRLTTIIPLGTPVILSGLLSTASGAWRVAVFQVVIILISTVIYFPFIRMMDQKAYAIETQTDK